MSKSDANQSTEDELLALIQAEPAEAFRMYPDELRAMREECDSERVRKLIDHVLDKYVNGHEPAETAGNVGTGGSR
ncbi:hypothetical protein [Natronomonas sp. LN261]|uniref:hypothetical protein n=1 Tax=Natronomonas sp. LN261 TaxID=2750669 RepID=UPI0015EE8947|nr:hypothetical protein [Natronomonas sp. LN261]